MWLLLSCQKLFPLGLQSEFRGLRTSVLSAPVGYLCGISGASLDVARKALCRQRCLCRTFNSLLPALREIPLPP